MESFAASQQSIFRAPLPPGSRELGIRMFSRVLRLLVTHDRRSMPAHFGALAATQSSAGVLIVPQNLPVRDAIEDLILIWACCEAEEWVDVLDFLPL